jgi:hypothetical protein
MSDQSGNATSVSPTYPSGALPCLCRLDYATVKLLLLLTLLLGSRLASPQQKPAYVGAETCGLCHPSQMALQSESAHTQALSPAARHRFADSFAPQEELVRPPRYHFQFRRHAGGLQVRVSDSKDALELPLEWAFGAGEQAVTFISRWDENWYLEHYFTYYSATGSLGPTPGHVGRPSHTLPLATGLFYRTVHPTAGIVQCFECHSTGPPRIEPGNLVRPAELGVRCEACHGPGQAHVQAATGGAIDKARGMIENPKRLSAAQLNQLCGRCHRAPVGGPVLDFSKPWNLRHQPIYLAKSACFLRSKGALSCLTCHDAHQKLDRELTHYDAKCLTCHLAQRHPDVAEYTSREGGGCVSCHMPHVEAQESIQFTNHWIGIYGAEKLLPQGAKP